MEERKQKSRQKARITWREVWPEWKQGRWGGIDGRSLKNKAAPYSALSGPLYSGSARALLLLVP